MEPREIDAAVEAVRGIADDAERAVAAHRLIRAMLAAVVALSDIRHFAVLALRAADRAAWPYRRLEELLGVRKTDVQAIVRGRRALRSERGED